MTKEEAQAAMKTLLTWYGYETVEINTKIAGVHGVGANWNPSEDL